MDFRTVPIAQLAAQVRSGERTAAEVVDHALARIEELNPTLGAFVAVDADRARAEAAAIDAIRDRGEELGPLAGIPVGVKDLEDAEGFVTTYGSALFAGSPPARRDSILVDRLRRAGCVVVGKTNTPEFGWKGDTDNPTFGPTRNPWNPERSAGGSSGGSAAAVASGMVPLATASDGGGSIRIPAALCGLPGFKPSIGRIPMGGPTPAAWPDLSVKGMLTNRVDDAVHVLDEVVGPHPTDQCSLPPPDTSWLTALDDPALPKRVLWSPTLGYSPVDGEVLAACEAAVTSLESSGVEVVRVDDVFDEDPVGAFLALSGTGNLRTVAEHRGRPEWEMVDPELRFVLEMAEGISGTEYQAHRDLGHLLNLRLVELFHEASFLLTPTVAGRTGPPGGLGTIDGVEDANWVRFTYPFNLSRSPAGSVPVGFLADGMPVGLQIVGPQHADLAVLRAMRSLEAHFGIEELPGIG